jgi:hypothetical protein
MSNKNGWVSSDDGSQHYWYNNRMLASIDLRSYAWRVVFYYYYGTDTVEPAFQHVTFVDANAPRDTVMNYVALKTAIRSSSGKRR